MDSTTGFLQTSTGAESSMRLIFIIGMVWAMLLITYSILATLCTVVEGGATFSVIATVFLGSKLWQNKQENKVEEIEINKE